MASVAFCRRRAVSPAVFITVPSASVSTMTVPGSVTKSRAIATTGRLASSR
jgi:hypothetical protein